MAAGCMDQMAACDGQEDHTMQFIYAKFIHGACSRKQKKVISTIRNLKVKLKQKYKKLEHKLARDLRYNNTLRIYPSVTPRHLKSDLVTVTHSTRSKIGVLTSPAIGC